MRRVDLYLSLGSNRGHREKNLENALSLLNIELGVPFSRLSSFIETEPWGFESEAKFLNAAVLYKLNLPANYNPEAEALMILAKCKEIERKLGRTEEEEYDEGGKRIYHDRPIDIDILLFGDHRINCPELTVPHMRMYEREFVMVPLKEIFPQAVDEEI